MDITPFGPDDSEAILCFVEVANAVRAADSPFEHPLTPHEAEGILRYGWDLEPALHLLVTDDGRAVGVGQYETSTRDNLHLAWLGIEIHPLHRRRGHGTALLEALVERARGEGRTLICTDGWDSPAVRGFAASRGLDQKHVEIGRRQVLAELDHAALDRAWDAASVQASSYELVRRLGPTPEEELAATAVMVAAINDAPLGDLDIEDEVFSPERVRAYETAMTGRGILLHRVLARHRETHELAGQTVVGVDLERPHLAEQHDTSVVAAHRGHRLGLLLKIEMLRWLREDQPQVETIDTWNAESNKHMVDVNVALGYRVLGRGLAFQRSL